MTIKLYDLDAYQTTFEATVLSCTKREKDYDVILDQTLFFPEEGGQTCDQGTLNDVRVHDVQIIDQEIHHYVNDPLKGKIIGKIDFKHRYTNMQNHSGEHVLSGLVKEMFGFDNSGFHLSPNEITTDYSGFLNTKQLEELEKRANEVILENHPIHCFYPEDTSLYDYRSKKEINEALRIVEIEGIDCCACCAPHVRSTSEIGLIKILKAIKHKQGVRIWFICGYRAYQDYHQKHLQAMHISQKLSLPSDDLTHGIDRLINENNDLKQEISKLKKQSIDLQIQSLSVQDFHLVFVEELDRSLQLYYCNQLLDLARHFSAVFVGKENNYRFYITSHEDARFLLEKLKENFEVKGGGKKDMVQGQIQGSKEDIEELLNNL